MTTAEKDEQDSGAEPRPNLHRPTDDIEELPRLRPRPIGSRSEGRAPKPPVRAGTLFAAEQGQGAAGPASPPTERSKKVVLRKVEEQAGHSAFATHQPAPPDERAEAEVVRAIAGQRPQKTVSAAFVLGVALIVVVLVGGVSLVRLGKKVGALETRVSHLERTKPESLLAGSSLR